jgi:hypothetical protein
LTYRLDRKVCLWIDQVADALGDLIGNKVSGTDNLRCSLLVNVTFPSFMRGQNR